MSYTVPECFMAAFAAGLMFSLVYEALRIVRVIFPFRIVVFVCDVVFFLLAALAVTRLSMALGDISAGPLCSASEPVFSPISIPWDDC